MNIMIFAVVAGEIIERVSRENIFTMIAHCFPDIEKIVDYGLMRNEAAAYNPKSECYRVNDKAFEKMSVQRAG